MKKYWSHLIAAAAGTLLVAGISTSSVKAEGYWVDGYWDGTNNVWVEGRWVEDGAAPAASGGWNAGPYQEYANGAVIRYNGNGSFAGTTVTNVPYYSQRNGAWAGVRIGEGGNFGSTGCVPTSAAMILNHFGIGGSPLDVGYLMNSWGNYNSGYGHGTDSGALLNVGAAYGLAVNAFADYDSLYYALSRGKLVAACIGGNSAYTHCVVLYGLDPYGNTTVANPTGGVYRTNIASIVNNMSCNPIDWTAGGPFVAFGYEW